MKTCLPGLFALMLLFAAVTATASVWRTTANGKWADEANWSFNGEAGYKGPPPATAVIYIEHKVAVPTSLELGSGVEMNIGATGDLTVNGELAVSGVLVNQGRVIVSGTMRLQSQARINNMYGGSIAVEGDLRLSSDVCIMSNAGYCMVNGDIDNHGTLQGEGGSYDVSGDVINKDCSAVMRGKVRIIEQDGSIENVCGTVASDVEVQSDFESSEDGAVDVVFVELNGRANVLEMVWITTREMNTQLFVLERSKDGQKFKEVKSTEAAHFSTRPVHYVLVDDMPLGQVAYYRLKMVDMDDKAVYSHVMVSRPLHAIATKGGRRR